VPTSRSSRGNCRFCRDRRLLSLKNFPPLLCALKIMSKTYAIADLHGRFDLLEMALARIADHAELPATVVTLGDYVDRGPDSRKLIERLMSGLSCEGWRLICLKGNHEDIMWQTCRRKIPDCDWWLTNGGGATLISYGQKVGDEVDVAVVPDEHLKW